MLIFLKTNCCINYWLMFLDCVTTALQRVHKGSVFAVIFFHFRCVFLLWCAICAW
ncbi:hypothetical protein X975_26949, partial [Stegodyphus mimosarum]